MTDISRFIQRLQDTTMTRRRDAARQLGRSGNPAAVGALGAALADGHPGVRVEIVQALGRLEDPAAVPFLVTALCDTEPGIRAAAIAALGRMKDPAAVDPLLRCLGDRDMAVRIGATEILGKLGSARILPHLETLEHDPFSEVREAAAAAIARIDKKRRGTI